MKCNRKARKKNKGYLPAFAGRQIRLLLKIIHEPGY